MIGNTRNKETLVITAALIVGAVCIINCGGGGGGSTTEIPQPSQVSHTLASEAVGVTYSISVGLPPGYDASGEPCAAFFLLDGNWFFNGFYSDYDQDDDFILIGINNSDRRNIDYLPPNMCESEQGGNAAFLTFLVSELVPYLDARYHIDSGKRLLFGHSHGGSFVFYTLFADHGETFPLLFSNDASVHCWAVSALEQAYYSANDRLPVIFYSSGASEGFADAIRPIMDDLAQADYQGFTVRYDEFQGSHDGILDTATAHGFAWIASQVQSPSEP